MAHYIHTHTLAHTQTVHTHTHNYMKFIHVPIFSSLAVVTMIYLMKVGMVLLVININI